MMHNKNIFIFIGLFVIQFFGKTLQQTEKINYTYNNITSCDHYNDFVYLYNKDKVINKEGVLKITDKYYTGYYCKNDTCVCTNDCEYKKHYIEFPDNNGNIVPYIVKTYSYDIIKAKKYSDKACKLFENNIEYCIYYTCNSNLECLSNKCIDNHCVFNEETPIVHCDDIYTPPFLFKSKGSYMYCGKAYKDTCKDNNECSSKICKNNTCDMQIVGPIEGQGFFRDTLITEIIIFVVLILIIIICICICCRCYRKKYSNKKYNYINK